MPPADAKALELLGLAEILPGVYCTEEALERLLSSANMGLCALTAARLVIEKAGRASCAGLFELPQKQSSAEAA